MGEKLMARTPVKGRFLSRYDLLFHREIFGWKPAVGAFGISLSPVSLSPYSFFLFSHTCFWLSHVAAVVAGIAGVGCIAALRCSASFCGSTALCGAASGVIACRALA